MLQVISFIKQLRRSLERAASLLGPPLNNLSSAGLLPGVRGPVTALQGAQLKMIVATEVTFV